MAVSKTYRLTELTSFIRRVFALNLPEAVWVTAELAQANVSRGHVWLTLVEKEKEAETITAQLEGVVWASQLQTLQRTYGIKLVRDLLREGMSVRLKVTTSFHERFGLKVVVEDIDPSFTIGELERKRQELLTKLAAEGLLVQNRQLPFPLLPQRLAVISSETAAGLADFKQQLAENPYGYQFTLKLFPAAMQGGNTSPEILARLRQVQTWDDAFDAIVIIRGGGGRTDLTAFDEESLARAVASCSLPVIVGIGHETDASVLDQVAARSLKTPTATAVFLIEQMMIAEHRSLQLGRSIAQLARHRISSASLALEPLKSLIHQVSRASLTNARLKLDQVSQQLNSAEKDALRRQHQHVDHLEQLLTALRPEATLARGYALASQEGRLLTTPEEIKDGPVTLRLKDGSVTLKKSS